MKNASVCQISILQSTLGVFIGSLAITNGLPITAQPIKMALRSGATGPIAYFDATGSTLLPNIFSLPASVATNGFQLTDGYAQQLTNSALGRPMAGALSFGPTQSDPAGNSFITPVTMTLTGLTASGLNYSGTGILSLSRSQ